MFSSLRATTIKVLSTPRIRSVFILGTLVVAALAGGAPSDVGGGH